LVPTTINSTATADATFYLDVERGQLEYQISFGKFTPSIVTNITLNGPAAVGQNGPVVYTFPLASSVSGKLTGFSPTMVSQIMQGQFYVTIQSDSYQNGHLRGQIRGWQQVQWQSVVELSYYGTSPSHPFGTAVFQLDLQKMTLSYYILYGGLGAAEDLAVLFDLFGTAFFELDGANQLKYEAGVKQGTIQLPNSDVNGLLSANYLIVVASPQDSLSGFLVNWT